MLQVILPGTSGLAAGEGALVISFAGVYTQMAGEVATGCETAFAGAANMFFLWAGLSGLRYGRGGGGGRGLAGIGEILRGGVLRVTL